MRYPVIIVPTNTGYFAWSPDLDGCVATGRTREEVEGEMREAIAFKIDGLRKDGLSVPEPRSFSTHLDIVA